MDGASEIKDYFARAKEVGIDHLTVTDHGSLISHREFQRRGKEEGIRIGLGVEAYITHDRFDVRSKANRNDGTSIYNHIGLIAKNENGLKNLYAINKEAWLSGFYYKPRLDFELLEEFHEDIIVLSGCLNGVLSKALEADDFDGAVEQAMNFKRLFKDDYYIEVMDHNPKNINDGLFEIADKLHIKPIITSDCHHASPDDIVTQEAMLILSTSPKVNPDFNFSKSQKMDWLERFNYVYPDRKMTFEKFNLHLKNGISQFENMKKAGYDRVDIIENTMEIAEKIGEYPEYRGLDLLPKPKTEDPDALLRKRVFAGLEKLGKHKDQIYIDRAEHELKVIKDKGFATYFLIISNTVRWAKQQDIRVGPGRGSAAGSLVCWSIGVTKPDPIEYGLIFERFLNPFRDDWPDVDIDFQDDRRDEVKDYVERQWKHVGNIMTFTRLEGKNIVKDAARVCKVPLKEVDAVAKVFVDYEDYCTSKNTLEFRKKYPEVKQLGDKLKGKLRSVGMHAAGIVVSSKPLTDYVPIESAENKEDKAKGRVPVLAMDGPAAADIGLIKMDFLGLKNLTVIQSTLDIIKERYGKDIDIDEIDLEDSDVYKTINKRSTLGVFQMEGAAFTKILDQMPIEKFDDIVAATSLIRPGAADSEFGKQYLDFRNHGNKTYLHDDVDWIIEDTSGVLYQEQTMQLCVHLCGMTPGESELVRKAVGKKKPEELEKWRVKFIDGATEKIGVREAKRLWHNIEASANYSFNKSHAVSYSLITYQCLWLKHYYPAEFVYAMLKHESDSDKMVTYLMEAKRMGVPVKMPHVNESGINYELHGADNPYIRIGLSQVKYVGEKAAKKIIESRPYESYEQLKEISERKFSGINSRALSCLDKVGAIDLPDHPKRGDERDYYFEYLNLPAFNWTTLSDELQHKVTKIDEATGGVRCTLGMVKKVERKNGWCRIDFIDETGSDGAFTSPQTDITKGNAYLFVIDGSSILEHIAVGDIKDSDSAIVRYLNLPASKPLGGAERVLKLYSRETKAGKLMGTLVTFNEDLKLTSYIVFPTKYHLAYGKAKPGTVVYVSAGETDSGSYKLEGIVNG